MTDNNVTDGFDPELARLIDVRSGAKLTALQLAAAIAEKFGDRLRWVQLDGVWRIYDDQTGVWSPEDRGGMLAFARRAEVAATGYTKADISTVGKALSELKTPPLAVTPFDFDADPSLMCVGNGVLDPRTGKLRPHDPGLLLTRRTMTRYEPRANVERWVEILRGMRLSQAAVEFLQEFAGYALVRGNEEELMLVLAGPKWSGKSTFVDALQAALGRIDGRTDAREQALVATVGPSTLMKSKDPEDRYTMASVVDARVITTTEPAQGAVLDASFIKRATGGDVIKVRHPGGRPYDRKPAFVPVMATNSVPRVKDEAMSRRLRIVEFTHTFTDEERDPSIKRWVRSPEGAEAFLAWAVDGCRRWSERGHLETPHEVLLSTARHLSEDDTLGRFLEDECLVGTDAKTPTRDVLARYRQWCEVENETPMSGTAFGIAMGERGHGKVRSNGQKLYPVGLRERAKAPF